MTSAATADIHAEPAQITRERVISEPTLHDLCRLAQAAIVLHDTVTHYGQCDVCDLVKRYRYSLRGDVDVRGLK